MNKKKIVITLHGIRTTGKWQKALDTVLASSEFVPYALDYGWKSRLAADQVLFVHNEYATKDPWPKVAGWIPWLNAGSSGRNGFSTPNSTRFSQQGSPRGHEVAIF